MPRRFLSLSRCSPVACAAVLVCAAAAPATQAATFVNVYVFGDSLSDNGNFFRASGLTNPASPPYDQGRFSNGPVAVEYLAGALGSQLHDYAVGGASSGYGNADIDISYGALYYTGLLSQVNAFGAGLSQAQEGADPKALYVVWAGANDFLSAPVADLADPAKSASIIGTAVSNLTQAVGALYADGARHFLLPLMPNLGATPQVLAYGAQAGLLAAGLSSSFNDQLKIGYDALATQLTGESFTYFDTFSATNAAYTAIGDAGGNVTDGCISSAAALAAGCQGFMFFDDVHPTTAVHQLLGLQMAAAVPEPASILSLSLGVLVLLGVSACRHCRV
jgi:phospholipase/lecithinase/hemolysin